MERSDIFPNLCEFSVGAFYLYSRILASMHHDEL